MRAVGRAVPFLFSLCGLAGVSVASGQDATPGPQWLSYNNHLDGQRFSPLKEVTPANAARLGEVCRVQIDEASSYHSALIVVDGVIYTNTPAQTVAIDATTCAVRWKHTYTPDEDSAPGNRGVAVLDGRVFRGTGDARLIALDAATGKVLWKNLIGTPRLGESASAAPLAWQGVVYMAISGSEFGVRGRVMAYDAQTGRELWRFNTVPMGDETGANTWTRPESAKTGGGGVWGAMTLDVTTGELFVPVGNPWPDIDKAYRPGTNLFTDSIVVLDARSGALKWWHQVTPSDWQDLDLVAPPVLYRDRKIRDVVAFAGKDGYVTALDRDTRKQLFRTPVTTIETPHEKATPEGVRICPGIAGGVEWNGPALDTLNNLLITGAVDVCFKLTSGPTQYSPSTVVFGGTVEPDGPVTGWLTALDSETGEVRWKYHAEKPVIAGVTPTAGGVTFTGDLAGNFLVFNSKSGELVLKKPTGGAMAGGVVTYEMGGKQYVAFASGNISRNAFGALGMPSVVIMALDAKPVAASAPTQTPVNASTPVGSANVASGRKLYSQICASCHGPDGNQLAAHKLSTLGSRRDRAATVSYIKDPKAPMPKLFPDLINEQNVVDVTAYLHDGLAK
ncbi:MAG: PQQ-binding-like beta-propeller repeat protein [Gammaproteobacteria bacterium]